MKQIISEICLNKINILGSPTYKELEEARNLIVDCYLEDLFDLEYNPQRLVEDLRKDREIVNSYSDSDLDLYSDVLDQIDEFAIKVESLRLRLNKKKQKKTPSKDSRSKIRRLIFQRKKERERIQQRKSSKCNDFLWQMNLII